MCSPISNNLTCCFSKNDCTPANSKGYAIVILVVTVVMFGGGAFLGGIGVFSSGALPQPLLFIAQQIGSSGSTVLFTLSCVLGTVGVVVGSIWLVKARMAQKSADEDEAEGETELQRAARAGNVVEMERLLTAENVNQKDSKGRTLLHHAIMCDRPKAVRKLLASGADKDVLFPGTPATDGPHPIEYAASHNLVEIVRILVEKGVDINFRLPSTKESLCHFVARNGNLSLLKVILDLGADIRSEDNIGWIPLHGASCVAGNVLGVKELLKRGAQIDAQDKYGSTPLHYAVHLQDLKVVKVLIARGANVNSQNHSGVTPLHQAAVSGDKAMILVLLESGAQIDLPNNEGKSAIRSAMDRYNDPSIAENVLMKEAIKKGIRALVLRGARVNAADRPALAAILQPH